jgi:hypothetical protein
MNKFSKMPVKLVAGVLILVMVLLAGCTTGPVTACHATGNPEMPYEEITIDSKAMAQEHLKHPGDIYPVPEGGCPTTQVEVVNEKITICHATGIASYPYREVRVNISGLNGHGKHAGDIIPAPAGGCPTSPLEIVNEKVSICHATGIATNPYEQILVSVNGLDGHVYHENDIVPAPVGGCPAVALDIVDGKITICHVTSSETNPYREIRVSVNGLNGHADHEGDLIPAPEAGCPASLINIVNEKITICHATGSEKNPFSEITISVNGLSGHEGHVDDIIPAPAGGCPTIN